MFFVWLHIYKKVDISHFFVIKKALGRAGGGGGGSCGGGITGSGDADSDRIDSNTNDPTKRIKDFYLCCWCCHEKKT